MFVGLVLTVVYGPGIFQMIGGAPKILPIFDHFDRPKSRSLIFGVQNAPIENKFLQLLKVYRQDSRQSFSFTVREVLGGELATVTRPETAPADAQGGFMVVVQAPWHAGISILVHTDAARIMRADSDIATVLKPGTYAAEIVAISNDRVRRWTKEFVVGVDHRKTSWIN